MATKFENSIKLFEVLNSVLVPPGFGIKVFSTGADEKAKVIKAYLKSLSKKSPDADSIFKHYEKNVIARLKDAKVALIGVPSDVGAGIRRGSAYGPYVLREKLYQNKSFKDALESGKLIDLGDIFCNPHLLHDEMLSDPQIKSSQTHMYPELKENIRNLLPVSVLSQLEFILTLLFKEFPNCMPLVLGGDHSLGWPIANASLLEHPDAGILQFDAHTDLFEQRLGVKYCFGTWSFHAAKQLKDPNRFVQIGIRESTKTKDFWESETGVKQIWANEVTKSSSDKKIKEIVSYFKFLKVEKLYISIDIDGTDAKFASATGTPAFNGLKPDFVRKLIKTLSREFKIISSDLVEVAPSCAKNKRAFNSTLTCASKYILELIKNV